MYKNELDKHIQNNTISNSIILFGESSFLINLYLKTLLAKVKDASILAFYYDEYNYNSAKNHLSQASLFGGRNTLIIKSEKKINKKELEVLADFCEKNPDNFFIYAYYGTDNKAYAKGLSKRSTMSVRFFHPKEYEAQNIILQIAKEKDIIIDKHSVIHLLNVHNGDIALSVNELDKFKIYDTPVTVKEIDQLVYGLGEINLDSLIKTILNKKDYKADVKKLLDHGEDEIKIITTLTSYITQLYMFNIYIRVNGAPNALDILGYPAPKFVVDEKAQMSIKIKPQTYYKLHEILLESELKMKRAGVDKEAILLSTLINLQRIL
jgi:DNA polymerase-3 subunit delta